MSQARSRIGVSSPVKDVEIVTRDYMVKRGPVTGANRRRYHQVR